MIVSYVSFAVEGDPRDFVAGFEPLAERIRDQKGCLAYDHLVDPTDPTRHVTVEVWETKEDHASHLADPAYIELLARGSREWGMGDLRVHAWTSAEGHYYLTLDRTDTPIPGRDEMNRLVAAFIHGLSP